MKSARGLRIGAGHFGRSAVLLPTVLMSFLLMFMVSLISVSEAFQPQTNRSDAADSKSQNIDVSVDVLPALLFSVSTSSLALGDLNVVEETLATGSLIATVSTNNPAGYTLSTNMKTDEQCMITIVDDGKACDVLDWTRKLVELPSDDLLEASIPTNSWGGAVTPFTNYNPIPAASGNAWNLHVAPEGVFNDQTVLRIGAKADLLVVPGLYRNTIVINAVANPLPVPIITDITPSSGVAGTPVALMGVNFNYMFEVFFGDNECLGLDISSNTSAGCEAPEGLGLVPISTTSIFEQTNMSDVNFIFPEEFKFTIDTRMTDTLDTDPTHYNGSSTVFNIPVSGYVNNVSVNAYNWIINCGDGSADRNESGTGTNAHAGIVCNYAVPGEYQITIRSNGAATNGWMNAFGFYVSSSGANIQTNKNKFKSIDTPLPSMSRSSGSSYRFAYMFYGTKNAVGAPANLFVLSDTSGTVDMSSTFVYTFAMMGYNSTTATIPADLFDPIDTSSATNLTSMFSLTFQQYAYNSSIATIPAGLFDFINLASATNTSSVFSGTFQNCAYKSLVATIPARLFDSFVVYNTVNMTSIFSITFQQYAYSSTIASIPVDLFNVFDLSKASGIANMFSGTFYTFAYMNSTPTTDINSIWGNMNFAGKVTNSNASTMFNSTFNSMRSLTGTAQTFINTKLGGVVPTASAQTFTGTKVTDLGSLNANWR